MKLPITVSEESKEPIYHQIESQLKGLMISGQLVPGSVLPSIRALSNELSCSVITTRRAYQNLENEGFIKTIQGKGTFVNEVDQKSKDQTKEQVASSILEKTIKDLKMLGMTRSEAEKFFFNAMDKKWGENHYE